MKTGVVAAAQELWHVEDLDATITELLAAARTFRRSAAGAVA
jgi:hypothetical protein